MAKLAFIRQGSGRTAACVAVNLRAAPGAVAEWLGEDPDTLEKWTVRGQVLVTACYTQRGRFLPRESFTWLRPGATPTEASTARRFTLTADRFSLELDVLTGSTEELHLAGRSCPRPNGSVFASAREAAEYLARRSRTRVRTGHVWEPLEVIEARWQPLGLPEHLRDAFELDSAFRQVKRPLTPVTASEDRIHASVETHPLPSS